jgi:hypothetical protein
MPNDLPIACSLDATALPRRLAEMRDVGRDALLDVDRSDRRAVLRFRAGAETRARLAAIVAAEASCCAFLDMTMQDDDAAVALSISAPPGAEPVLDDLVAAFSGEVQAA